MTKPPTLHLTTSWIVDTTEMQCLVVEKARYVSRCKAKTLVSWLMDAFLLDKHSDSARIGGIDASIDATLIGESDALHVHT